MELISPSFTVGLPTQYMRYKIFRYQNLHYEEAIYVEQEMINVVAGVQDQITAAYGGINVIKLGPEKEEW